MENLMNLPKKFCECPPWFRLMDRVNRFLVTFDHFWIKCHFIGQLSLAKFVSKLKLSKQVQVKGCVNQGECCGLD